MNAQNILVEEVDPQESVPFNAGFFVHFFDYHQLQKKPRN